MSFYIVLSTSNIIKRKLSSLISITNHNTQIKYINFFNYLKMHRVNGRTRKL